ncbi:MAG: hypothetical protein ATN35_09600 [Epulopiscium sp. Nele67-Bin004]|nr:MAG: hypothetical protein ATN35_09600 [Epulopiscium sp. Nele67-Bin004]
MQFITDFIEHIRKKQGYSQHQVIDGLCNQTYFSKLETGENYPNKLLLDTIFSRLDIEEGHFEHLVSKEEFEIRKLRLLILEKIACNELVEAKILFEQFKNDCDEEDKLEVQFANYIELIFSEITDEQRATEYKKLIVMTVPQFRKKALSKLALSNAEVFLISEYCIVSKDMKIAKQLLAYLRGRERFTKVKLKCATKLLCMFAKHYNFKQSDLDELCKDILEHKRKENDLFYFTKLLDIMDRDEQLELWRKTLLEVYDEYNINPNEDNLLIENVFSVQGYYVLGDVIKSRRNMLGLTNEQLAEGICSKNTISRVQNDGSRLQLINAEMVLERLNMTGDLYTDNVKITDMMLYDKCAKLTWLVVKGRYDEAWEVLEFVKSRLDLSIKVNEQYVAHKELGLRMRVPRAEEEKVSQANFLKELEKILEITLPIKGIVKSKLRHFTKKEIVIMNTLMWHYGTNGNIKEMDKWRKILEEYYSSDEIKIFHGRLYYSYKLQEASMLGNLKEYDKSTKIAKSILNNRRLTLDINSISWEMYNVVWNYRQAIEDTRELVQKEIEVYLPLINQVKIVSEIFESKNTLHFSLKDIESLFKLD